MKNKHIFIFKNYVIMIWPVNYTKSGNIKMEYIFFGKFKEIREIFTKMFVKRNEELERRFKY